MMHEGFGCFFVGHMRGILVCTISFEQLRVQALEELALLVSHRPCLGIADPLPLEKVVAGIFQRPSVLHTFQTAATGMARSTIV